MARRMPHVADGALHATGAPGRPEIAVGSPSWVAWLRDPATRSFSFRGPSGRFTARKEHRVHGGEYWTAYRKRDGRLRKAFLGKAEKLTPEKLNDAAAVLARSDDDVTANSATEVATDEAETVPTNEAATVSPVAPDDHTRELPHHSISDPSIVLTPKLRAPTPRPEQLVRPRLLELLGEALHRKATLISAPAGYGKTTLLAQWRKAQVAGLPFAWVSLDEQDNDPVRLWRHIEEALRRVAPEEGFGADDIAEMSAAGQKLLEIVLPTLINGLAELPLNMVVVLDDYQVITEGEGHESVAFFLEHLPANVHLVLSSRTDPPLPLGRLRARGEMMEIRTDQLAFSEEEAACLLNEKMGVELDPDDLSVLLERSEGWPAGIYLAALSMQNSDDKHSYVASFGGNNRYIVDLLGEDVLASLPQEVREFLLSTSVLSSMTGPLCDVVVGGKGSGKVLRELAPTYLLFLWTSKASGIVTTTSSRIYCTSSSRATTPSWCPYCTPGRACGWRMGVSLRGRSSMPAQPQTMSARWC